MAGELLGGPGGAALLGGPPSAGGIQGYASGPLARFFPETGALSELVVEAAVRFEQAGQLDEAAELYARCGATASSLALINRRLAQEISFDRSKTG